MNGWQIGSASRDLAKVAGLLGALLALGAAVVVADTAGTFRGVPGYIDSYLFARKAVYALSFVVFYAAYERWRGPLSRPIQVWLGLSLWLMTVTALWVGTVLLVPGLPRSALIAATWLASGALLACGLGLCAAMLLQSRARQRQSLRWCPHIIGVVVLAQTLFTSVAFQTFCQTAAMRHTLSLSAGFYKAIAGQEFASFDLADNVSPLVVAGNFAVRIDPSCSGLVGLLIAIVAFGLYLVLARRTIRLGRAVVLVMAALAAVFVANALRIALLVLIGASGHADIAVSGFHSHFGLLSLMALVSAALLLLGTSAFQRMPEPVGPRIGRLQETAGLIVLSPAFLSSLKPLALYLFVGLILGLASTGFDWLYPLRFLAGALLVVSIWRRWSNGGGKLNVEPVDILCGIIVFLVWIQIVPPDHEADASFSFSLDTVAPPLAYGWIFFRACGAIAVVPLLEELAFRNGLQRHVGLMLGQLRPGLTAKLGSILLSSVAFGALHAHFLAGFLAGSAYAALYALRRTTQSAVVAHVTTNSILALYVIFAGQWSYW
jgi:exosortase E/protease (VPEID-CTERM system)